MRVAFAFFRAIIIAAGLTCVIAGALMALTASSGARSQQTAPVFVDRTNKSDQFPYASRSQPRVNSSLSTTTPQVSPKRPPFGCDAAFSSAADPTQAHIYKRCMA